MCFVQLYFLIFIYLLYSNEDFHFAINLPEEIQQLNLSRLAFQQKAASSMRCNSSIVPLYFVWLVKILLKLQSYLQTNKNKTSIVTCCQKYNE